MPKRYEEELFTLFSGYQKFRERFTKYKPLFERLATHGQRPKTMVICCSDSRVDPTIILDCAPGEVFVVRNVANLVPAFDDKTRNNSIGAALQFAVLHLEVKNIILLGHSHCGGIGALLKSDESAFTNESASLEEKFILDWVKIARIARQKVLSSSQYSSDAERAKACEEQALLVSLENLKTYPWIKERVEAEKIFLQAWRFDIGGGIIQHYNAETNMFEELTSGYSLQEEKEKMNSLQPKL